MKKTILIAFLLVSFIFKGNSQTEKIKFFSLTDRKVKVGEIYILLGVQLKGYPLFEKPQTDYELDTLAGFLKKHKNVKIEIGCHCDYRPISMTNDTLTNRQAIAIREYLIKKGINAERLVAVGYGSHKPRLITENSVHNGVTFKKGTLITEAYIKTLKTTPEKMAAYDLCRRIEIKIIEVK